MYVLTLNAGSSSIKCALFEQSVKARSIFSLAITCIGSTEATLVSRVGEGEKSVRPLGVKLMMLVRLGTNTIATRVFRLLR